MQASDNDSNSSQGFFAHELSVLKHKQQSICLVNSEDLSFSEANQLISYQRPTDLIPRTIASAGEYIPYPSLLNHTNISPNDEDLIPINVQKNKQKRYASLKDKYYNNQEFKCVYSKMHENSQFDGYIFSLQNTTDYNPDDYICPSTNQLDSIEDPADKQKFNSRFESGNLLYAYKTKNTKIEEYDLIMQNDTNTKGYNQWFYFSFENLATTKVRFNIVNFIKKRLMFLDGVKPVAFSLKNSHLGWRTIGSNISYRKSFITRTVENPNLGQPPSYKNYYTLSFDVDFNEKNDTTYIAMNYPYTYSNMISFVNRIIETAPLYVQIQKSIVCHTISNNPIICLRIKHKQFVQKGKIACFARQHPGQSVGSFVFESFISNIITHQNLLRNYEIVAIPMVNPDGVIYGNFRTNLSGFDLNRQWINPNRWLHPQIFFLKKFVSSLTNIVFCLDFHGHSKKLNSFIYACVDEGISNFRVYPYMIGGQSELFSVRDCTYSITPDKIRTARINLYNQIKKPYIYTLETSFFGYTKNKKNYRFTHRHFIQIGKASANCLQTLLMDKSKMRAILQQVNDKAYLFDQWSTEIKDNIDSQSNPSEDQLNVVERKNKVMSDMAIKRKAMKKRKKKNRSKPNDQLKIQRKSSKKLSQKLILGKKDKTIPQNKLEQQIQITKPKKTQGPKLQKQKAQSNVVIMSKAKIAKPQFIQKVKPIQNIIEIKEKIKNQLHQISKNRKLQKKQQIQEPKQERQSHSNLLQGSGYLKFRQQKMKMIQQQRKLSQAQYYLSMMTPTSIKCSSKALLGQALQYDNNNQKKQKGKLREKIYIIKQHKVINSITRVNDQQIKEQLEKQIQSRTNTLKNCQKMMNNITDPLQKQKINSNIKLKLDDAQTTFDVFKNRTFLKPIEAKKPLEARHSERIDRRGIFFYNL